MEAPVRPTTGRRGDIQGLRAVAVLLVVLFHAGLPVPGGFVGVDVFFVISGYVITRLLCKQLASTDRIDLRAFYLRRIRRILPALAVLLVFTLLAGILLSPIGGQKVTAYTGASASMFSANLYLIRNTAGYFDVRSSVNALLHTWSLSVEEQFYLVFPGLLLGAWFLAKRYLTSNLDRVLIATLGSVFVVSFVSSWVLTDGVGPVSYSAEVQRFAFYSAPTRAWEFALGGLVALSAGLFVRLRPQASFVLALVGVAGIGWASLALSEQSPFPGLAAVPPVVGTALLIAAGECATSNAVNRALSSGPAQWLGGVSYSWYLWHWPLIVFAGALWPGSNGVLVVAAAISLAPAAASLHLVENPIRFTPRPVAHRTLALGAACIVVPIAAAGVLLIVNRVIVRNDAVRALDVATRFHADSVRGCDNPTPFGHRRQPRCEWRVPTPAGNAVLVGDSNAGQFTEAFTAGFNKKGWNAEVATLSSCPFADLTMLASGHEIAGCRGFVEGSMRTLTQNPPDVVVVASASDSYIRDGSYEFVRNDGTRVKTVEGKRLAWQEGTKSVVDLLERQGTQVVVINPAPKFGTWDPRECAAIRRLVDASSCGVTRSTTDLRRWRAPAVNAERQALAGSSAKLIDVFEQLCPSERCATEQAGSWTWRDGSHITVDASRGLTDVFSSLAQYPSQRYGSPG